MSSAAWDDHATHVALHSQVMTDLFQREMDEMHWSMMEAIENDHIGPLHRPGRCELGAVRKRERNRAELRAMGRAVGEYRRWA